GAFVVEAVYVGGKAASSTTAENNADEAAVPEMDETTGTDENVRDAGNADDSENDVDHEANATSENAEQTGVADGEKVDESIPTDKETQTEKRSLTTSFANIAEEKQGFKLELDEILDLDDEAFDEQHPMDPHEEFKLKLDWYLENGHNYVAGDTETFDLPKGIKIQKEITVELIDAS